jgi:chemotaxis family two-component system response regulator Rcp1
MSRADAATDRQDMSGPPQKSTLLYIEDDDTAVFLLQTALRDLDDGQIELVRARNGEEALARLQGAAPFVNAARPDLILLDLNLPRKGGLELLEDLCGDANLASIPVVIFSSSSLQADRARSLELGARDYILKPLTFPAFVDAVRAACRWLGK